jgi:hypothetical protein
MRMAVEKAFEMAGEKVAMKALLMEAAVAAWSAVDLECTPVEQMGSRTGF